MRRLLVALLLLFPLLAHAYEAGEVRGAATVKGVVIYSGRPPQDERIIVDRDRGVCGSSQSAGKYLLKGKRVQNVVVWLEGVERGKPVPESEVKLTISTCRVRPLVSVGFVGGVYRIVNEDPILHTVQLKLGLEYHKLVSDRPLDKGVTIYNLALPRKGMEITRPIKRFHRLTEKTGIVRVTSNTHPWMRAYIFVFDHPYATVTNPDGEFVIGDIPPGDYILKVWHEGFGTKEIRVNLRASETEELEIDLGGGTPSAGFPEVRFDFGRIELGERVSHDFRVLNEGDGMLRIVDLIPA